MCMRKNAALRNHPTHRHTSLPLASHFNLTCLRVCSPHVSGPSDRLRPSLRPFARRCCVSARLRPRAGSSLDHGKRANNNPPTKRESEATSHYPRVTCSTPYNRTWLHLPTVAHTAPPGERKYSPFLYSARTAYGLLHLSSCKPASRTTLTAPGREPLHPSPAIASPDHMAL